MYIDQGEPRPVICIESFAELIVDYVEYTNKRKDFYSSIGFTLEWDGNVVTPRFNGKEIVKLIDKQEIESMHALFHTKAFEEYQRVCGQGLTIESVKPVNYKRLWDGRYKILGCDLKIKTTSPIHNTFNKSFDDYPFDIETEKVLTYFDNTYFYSKYGKVNVEQLYKDPYYACRINESKQSVKICKTTSDLRDVVLDGIDDLYEMVAKKDEHISEIDQECVRLSDRLATLKCEAVDVNGKIVCELIQDEFEKIEDKLETLSTKKKDEEHFREQYKSWVEHNKLYEQIILSRS